MMAKGMVTFNEDLCKGCELCVVACPKNIVELDKSKINAKGFNPAHVVDMDECIACGNCAIMCPDSVISIEKL
ncbi:MAG TPA: 2-oxoacid:acceptor oxidoreductase [Clostridiales bacterium]|nr:2-oxoacid:acceptor oxidoreductase [Clostridiales bacterium]